MNKVKVEVKIRGVEEVLKNIDNAERRKILPALERGIHKAGYIVEASAKRKCPVDTGRLRKSINTVRKKLSVTVGTSVKYAPYVEFGTSKMRAQPFLYPAVNENIRKIEQAIVTEVKKAVG